MNEWISCKNRFPEKDGCYLVTTTGANNNIIDIAYYTDGIWHKACRIKAWMPLPEPYKEETSIDYVIRETHAYCISRKDCEGCHYAYKPSWGGNLLSCALAGTPDNWPLHELGGEKNGLSDANNTED